MSIDKTILVLSIIMGILIGFSINVSIGHKEVYIEHEVVFVQNGWKWTQVEKDIVSEIIKISDLTDFDWKLVTAIAQLETQMGIKVVGKNNLFNIKLTSDTYRNYETIKNSIVDFINLLMTSDYYKEFQVSKKLEDLFRYAEDPLWETKVQQIMNKL